MPPYGGHLFRPGCLFKKYKIYKICFFYVWLSKKPFYNAIYDLQRNSYAELLPDLIAKFPTRTGFNNCTDK